MNEKVCLYFNRVLEYEESGYITEAIQLLDKLVFSFPVNKAELLLEGAKLKYRNGIYEAALLNFMEVYRLTDDLSIFELVVEAYYKENSAEYLATYKKNQKLMQKYKYYYNNIKCVEKITILPLWISEELIVWADYSNHTFQVCYPTLTKLELSNTVIAVCNEVFKSKLIWLEQQSRLKEKLVHEDIPIYYIYDKGYWEFVLQSIDICSLLSIGRAVFLIGEDSVKNYFDQEMSLLPCWVMNEPTGGKYDSIIKGMIEDRHREEKKAEEEIIRYYHNHENKIIEDIKNKIVRVMFLTCRFTTVLQYHAKSCLRAARRLGYDAKLLIERDDICRITDRDMKLQIAEFKPHIVVSFDSFRYQEIVRQKEIVWVTWVQDPMPRIMNKDTPKKLIARDIIISHFTTWEIFKKIGYQDVIDAPIPADSYVYRPYHLSDMEYNQYKCDICFVCHASDVKEHIDWICEDFPPEWRQRISFLYQGYQNYVNQTGELFYKIEQFIAFVDGVLKKSFGISAGKEKVNYIANDMFSLLNQRIYRQCLVDWLLDAGYTNIKLWGNGWTKEEKYAKYAMGPAENGETLSKIYQASKIVLGNNVMTTAAARAWESMLSGAFYLSNYIPPEDDITDIRKIVKENEELIMFYDKEDLLRKVDYYLNHEEERKRMAEIGRKAALERMTFDKLMEKVIEEIPKIIEKREKKEMQEQNG